jgi:hypothetical protein
LRLLEIAEHELTRHGAHRPDEPDAGNVALTLTADNALLLARLLVEAARKNDPEP